MKNFGQVFLKFCIVAYFSGCNFLDNGGPGDGLWRGNMHFEMWQKNEIHQSQLKNNEFNKPFPSCFVPHYQSEA